MAITSGSIWEAMNQEHTEREARLDQAAKEGRVRRYHIAPEMLMGLFAKHPHRSYHFEGLPEEIRVVGAFASPLYLMRECIILHVVSPAFDMVPPNQEIPEPSESLYVTVVTEAVQDGD